MKSLKEACKILIVNLGGIGDVLLSMPALRALRKLYPNAHIAFLGVPRTCELAMFFCLFDETMSFAAYDERYRRFSFKRMMETLKLLFFLRRQQFDMIINMRTLVSWMSAFKMALIFSFIGAKYRVGRDTAGRGFFLNIKIRETAFGEKHEMEYDLDTVAALGADVSDREIHLDIERFDTESASAQKELLQNNKYFYVFVSLFVLIANIFYVVG